MGLGTRAVLFRPEEPIDTVYFPERGWLSMLAPLEDGDSAEVGLIRREGMVCLPVFLATIAASWKPWCSVQARP